MNSNRVCGTGGTKGYSSKVTEYCDCSIRFCVFANRFSWCDVFESISEEVGVGVAESERSELGDRDETVNPNEVNSSEELAELKSLLTDSS